MNSTKLALKKYNKLDLEQCLPDVMTGIVKTLQSEYPVAKNYIFILQYLKFSKNN